MSTGSHSRGHGFDRSQPTGTIRLRGVSTESRPYLAGANLQDAVLTDVRLLGATMAGSDLKRANLTDVKLRRAKCNNTTMPDGTKRTN